MNETAKQKTAALIEQMWQKNRGVFEERLVLLRAAYTQILAGRLDASMRAEASSIAHKMAGSLGIFGLPQASDAARQLEEILATVNPDASKFEQELNQLEEAIRNK